MFRRAILISAVSAAALGPASCGPNGNQPLLPTPQCPSISAAGDPLGPPTPQTGRASIRLAASQFWVAALVKKAIEDVPLQDPSGNFGAEVGRITLMEETSGGQTKNILAVAMSGWALGEGNKHVLLPGRTYSLRVQLLPHWITAANMPDATLRRSYLGCTPDEPCDTGVVVSFVYDSLKGGGTRGANAPVDCQAKDYDNIDEIALKAAIGAFSCGDPARCLRPMGFSLDSVLDTLRTTLK